MSGGHFDYIQYQIDNTIDQYERFIHTEIGQEYYDYSGETIKEIVTGLAYLKLAKIYLHRVDWLISGDDGEDSFHERLKDDLDDLQGTIGYPEDE